MTLYEKILALGLPEGCIDHHGSDLYVMKTPAVTALLKEEYQKIPHMMPKTFRSNTPPVGAVFYDIPFAYIPWWEEKAAKSH